MPGRDRGRALTDTVAALAAGASCLSDVEAVTAQVELFGPAGGASDTTVLRVLGEYADRLGDNGLPGRRLAQATVMVRSRAWEEIVTRHGDLPAVRVAGKALTRAGGKEGERRECRCPGGGDPVGRHGDRGGLGQGRRRAQLQATHPELLKCDFAAALPLPRRGAARSAGGRGPPVRQRHGVSGPSGPRHRAELAHDAETGDWRASRSGLAAARADGRPRYRTRIVRNSTYCGGHDL